MGATEQLPQSLAGVPPQCYIAAPSPVYLTGEEILRLTTFANAAGLTVTLSGRVLRPDNTIAPFTTTNAPASNRTGVSTIERLPEGWLLGAIAKVTGGGTSFGQVWGQLELVRGEGSAAIVVQSLANDFISTNAPLMFPGGQNVDPLDGAGNLRSITGTTPGAGADISETVPTAARWELIAFRAQLVTAVAVANRSALLTLDDGTNIFYGSPVITSQAASLTERYSWAPGNIPTTVLVTIEVPAPLPINNRLPAGARIRTATVNLQAADQWSAVQYLVREWLDV